MLELMQPVQRSVAAPAQNTYGITTHSTADPSYRLNTVG
jgi:hypothetical protein